MVKLKYVGVPNLVSNYRGTDGEKEIFCDSLDEELNKVKVSGEKASQLLSDFPDQWVVLNGSAKKILKEYPNKMIAVAEATKGVSISYTNGDSEKLPAKTKKVEWTDAAKDEVVKIYKSKEPTAENTKDIVKEIAVEFGVNVSSIRMILMQRKVYIKK